jgi:hypothetical protein
MVRTFTGGRERRLPILPSLAVALAGPPATPAAGRRRVCRQHGRRRRRRPLRSPPLKKVGKGKQNTATATDAAGNTSEFSDPRKAK